MSTYAELIEHCSQKPGLGGLTLKALQALAEEFGVKNAENLSRKQICAIFSDKNLKSTGECKMDKSLKGRQAPPYRASDCPGKIKLGGDGKHFWRSVISGSGFVWERVSKTDSKEKAKKDKYAGHVIRPDRPILAADKILLGWEGLRRPTEIPIPEVRKDLNKMKEHCKFLKELTKPDLKSPMTRRMIAKVAYDTREVVYKYDLDKKEVGLIPEFSPTAFKHNCETIQTKLESLIERKAYY